MSSLGGSEGPDPELFPLSERQTVTSMRLIRVSHIRCGEAQAWTYAWAPGDWSGEDIQKAVDAAQANYLEALAATSKSTPPNDYGRYGKPPYEKYPSKTVAEIDAEWEAKKPEWEAWAEEQHRTRMRFMDFLKEQGFESIWSNRVPDFEVDWGHRHGQPIDYSETETDTLNTPAHVAGQQGDDF